MPETTTHDTEKRGFFSRISSFFSRTPLLGWIIGALFAVGLEQAFGIQLAQAMGLKKVPVLLGFSLMFKTPAHFPAAFAYTTLIYVIPIVLTARFLASPLNAVSGMLLRMPMIVSVLVHLGLLYSMFHIWASISDYRLITIKLMFVAILLTLSLNLINGYMGEFSCSHPGFMALGAYAASMFTVGLFVDDRLFGDALIATSFNWIFFPAGLVFAGLVSALAALIIAIPSFKTRGDYLAIISLAFLFIVKSVLENLEFLGGPRGLSSQPNWATLPAVFGTVIVGIWIINNFVTSTLGKGLNAVRDDEIAAEAMTVNTRRVKITAFMFAAFWAGVAGGLFAHVLRYVNPATFGVQKLAEILAMMYLGGLNSVYGSIVGAVSISILGEALRPLEILKWIFIPLLLVLVMIFRPRGLISFTEFNVRRILEPKR